MAPKPISKRLRKRWRQKGLLTALGLVFSVSAVLRLGSLDFATAQPEDHIDMPSASAAETYDTAPVTGMVAGPLAEALADVETLRDRLHAQESALADRERAVAAAQSLVEARLAELETLEARLSDLVALSDQAAEGDIDRLTRVYETMPPEESAALFSQMSPSFAAGFLARMTPTTAAELMAELDPETAYAISFVLATRNVSAPRLEAEALPDDTEN